MTVWFIDSSVILRGLLGNSNAVRTWFADRGKNDDAWLGSRMLELEVRRVSRNSQIDTRDVDYYLDRFEFIAVTDNLIDDAIAMPHRLGSADALHVATALKLHPLPLTFVTHDAQQARAIQAMHAFDVHDPVTDDPKRPPVA